MNAEVDQHYGLPQATKTCKWALVLPITIGITNPSTRWAAVAWFKTRKRAEEYAQQTHGRNPYAIARGFNL